MYGYLNNAKTNISLLYLQIRNVNKQAMSKQKLYFI